VQLRNIEQLLTQLDLRLNFTRFISHFPSLIAQVAKKKKKKTPRLISRLYQLLDITLSPPYWFLLDDESWKHHLGENISTISPDNKAKRSLATLPEEVIELIAANCEEHVIALRSSCRDLQHKTFHVFSWRFFRLRHIWIDKGSLEQLRSIAEDERFAKCVRELHIHLLEWGLDFRPIPYRHLSGKQRSQQNYNVVKRAKAQKALPSSGEAIKLLFSSLNRFLNLDAMELAEATMEPDMWPVSHFKRIIQQGLQDDIPSHGKFGTDVWLTVVQALSQTQVKLIHFTCATVLPIEAITALTATKVQSLSTALASLDNLELNVEVPHHGPKFKNWQKALGRLLHVCPELTTLDIGFGDEEVVYTEGRSHASEDAIASLEVWPTFPKLAWISLRLMVVKVEVLTEYLQTHKATLKNVEFNSVSFAGKDEGWRSVLETLVDAPELEMFMFTFGSEDDEVGTRSLTGIHMRRRQACKRRSRMFLRMACRNRAMLGLWVIAIPGRTRMRILSTILMVFPMMTMMLIVMMAMHTMLSVMAFLRGLSSIMDTIKLRVNRVCKVQRYRLVKRTTMSSLEAHHVCYYCPLIESH
jgi:hypothetical protein